MKIIRCVNVYFNLIKRLRTIISNQSNELGERTEISINNDVVHWTGYNCFEIDASHQIPKSNIGRIIGYHDGFLTFEFTDRSWVTINYPNNLDDLTKEIESGLLQYKGWKRECLSTGRIKRIMDCLMVYLENIKKARRIQNTNPNTRHRVLKSTI